jgi:inner membrane protein
MPMTTTHALLPIAVTVAVARRPVNWRLVIAAAFAAAAPDLDGITKHIFHPSPWSVYAHRGAAHSLFAALALGLIAAAFHKWLRVRALNAGTIVFAAAASHGLLDMMTDSGQPVAYLWPVSSLRLWADWRPIHSGPVNMAHLFSEAFARLWSELWQLIVPMFAIALAVRGVRMVVARREEPEAGESV